MKQLDENTKRYCAGLRELTGRQLVERAQAFEEALVDADGVSATIFQGTLDLILAEMDQRDATIKIARMEPGNQVCRNTWRAK